MQTSTERSFVYVDSSGESRRIHATCADVGTSPRSGPSSRSNHSARMPVPRAVDGLARRGERALEVAQRDLLLLFDPRDRVGLARELGLELFRGGDQLESVVVEVGGTERLQLAELLAFPVVGEHRELRLRGAERQLLALPRHARAEQRVLERVLSLGELGGDDPGLAGLAQAVEALALVARRARFLLAQRLDLLAGEEVRVARDDRRLLGGLLLPHPHRAALLGALVEVALELGLVLCGGSDLGDAHVVEST